MKEVFLWRVELDANILCEVSTKYEHISQHLT